MLAACGGESDTTGAQAAPAPAVGGTTASNTAPATDSAVTGAPAAEAPATVPEALAFSAPLVGGGTLELGTLAGKPVVMWFWAPF